MKAIKYVFIALIGMMLFAACEKFLDKTPAASVTNQNVFGTYADFQGFLDPNYSEVRNYIGHYQSTTLDAGGEALNATISWSPAYTCWTGEYVHYFAGADASGYTDGTSLFSAASYGYGVTASSGSGIWTGGWRGIRVCNVALQNFKLLSQATPEEQNLIKGQIYFFRAWFHQQIIEAYGGMPYIDTVLAPGSEMKFKRLTYQETVEKIIADYDRALPLLPEDWDETTVGSSKLGANTGRATKGVVLAYKAKALLYAGSPLMNGFSGGDFVYNVEYCKRAAEAGWQMIQLANTMNKANTKKYYDLVPFTSYSDNFYKQDGTVVWTTETIWERMQRASGSTFYGFVQRQNSFPRLGGKYGENPNQWFVDKFEMADGSRYIPALYDNDNAKRWNFRDPRFRKAIIVDRDQHGLDSRSIINLYEGSGTDKSTIVALPYMIKKFWPAGANVFDGKYTQLVRINPLMRLAEVYLDYAEAVTVAYGANGTAPGASLTAVQAINIVRARAGMPPVTSAATGYGSFLELVQNERTVELCFEGHFFHDIRRWYIAHLPENKQCVDLKFDKNWTNFTRAVIKTKVFENPKHYWLPINRDQTMLYPGFGQNPGWQ
jgi:starch-binding outer membrane protein, SusD/RagB family